MSLHINAKKEDIMERVLLPGDPLRAKFIAENYLEDLRLVSSTRNMLAFTGTYKKEEISVMGTGMGIPSMLIYSHELIEEYGAKTLIRIGSCGAYQDYIDLRDLILVQGASTTSSLATSLGPDGTYSALADFGLLERAASLAREKDLSYHVGNILTADVFYDRAPDYWKDWRDLGVLGVEMETYGLYAKACQLGARALSILTVTDLFYKDSVLSPEDREKSLRDMIELALEI
mgnify:CR=1 FL=1